MPQEKHFRSLTENSTWIPELFHHEKWDITLKKFNDDLVISVLPVTIFIGVEAVLGFIGNILILCVYSKWYPECNFRYFVLFLAIYDFTSCLSTLPGEMFSQFHWYDYTFDWICKTKSYFNVFTAWGSASTLLLLAFDRYRKICRPLEWQIQSRTALKLCATGITLSALMSFPITILWGTQTYTSVIHGVELNVSVCEKSGEYANEIYPFLYIISVYILPLGIMMLFTGLLNFLIARKLHCNLFIHRLSNQKNVRMSRHTSETSISSLTLGMGKVLDFTTNFMSMKIFESKNNRNDRRTTTLRWEGPQSKDNRRQTFDDIGTMAAQHDRNSESSPLRRKRKTLIMLVLTSIFIVTMTLYIALLTLVSKKDNILRTLSNTEKTCFFFFWRLYFINSVINPALYGVMDPRFRAGLKRMFRRRI